MVFIAPIVEGHGEIEAVPNLLHRIATAISPEAHIRVNYPIRVKSGSFLNDQDYFRKMVNLAGAKAAQAQGFVIIILDCEDHCPAQLGPDLLARAVNARRDVPIYVALSYREYETWFITAVRSLQGFFGVPADIQPPPDPLGIRDAKGWLGNRMNVPYDPILHQAALTRIFDLDQARNNPSFNRIFRIMEPHIRASIYADMDEL